MTETLVPLMHPHLMNRAKITIWLCIIQEPNGRGNYNSFVPFYSAICLGNGLGFLSLIIDATLLKGNPRQIGRI